MAPIQPSLALADWVTLDRFISQATGQREFVPENFPSRDWEPLTREELPE